MRVNRIGYIMLIISLLIMFVMSGQSFLIYSVLALVVMAAVLMVLLMIDSANIQAGLSIAETAQFGKDITYVLNVDSRYGLLVTQSVIVTLDIHNNMFGSISHKTLIFELDGGKNDCAITLPASECGGIVLKCGSIHVIDMLKLFKIKTKPLKDARIVIFPKHMDINVELSDMIIGESSKEGEMQNRKGSDSSEIYDIREYKQGDNVHSIHWKLSEKTDKLFVREASEPSHYDVVIIPDFAHFNGDEETTIDELNTAIAITAAISEQLVIKGIHFCMMIPREQGLSELYVSSDKDYEKMLMQSMCFKILKQSGSGLEYFITEHKEDYYTRLVIVSAGKYRQNLSRLEKQLGITVINAVKDIDRMSIDGQDGLEVIDIPADTKKGENYHIIY